MTMLVASNLTVEQLGIDCLPAMIFVELLSGKLRLELLTVSVQKYILNTKAGMSCGERERFPCSTSKAGCSILPRFSSCRTGRR